MSNPAPQEIAKPLSPELKPVDKAHYDNLKQTVGSAVQELTKADQPFNVEPARNTMPDVPGILNPAEWMAQKKDAHLGEVNIPQPGSFEGEPTDTNDHVEAIKHMLAPTAQARITDGEVGNEFINRRQAQIKQEQEASTSAPAEKKGVLSWFYKEEKAA